MNTLTKTLLAAMALMALAACDNTMKTSTNTLTRESSIKWDVVTAADHMAQTPRNQNLIAMR